jgi:CRP-like cAMP-binding protein
MSIPNLTAAQHPFLNGLSEPHLRILGKTATPKRFAAGDRFFREGEAANGLYLVNTGNICLQTRSAGQPVRIATIGPGEVVGWSWLFPPFFWHFDASADETTEAIVFDAAQLRKDCEEDKAFGYELMKRVAEIVVSRLQVTRLKLVQSVKHDLAAALPKGE